MKSKNRLRAVKLVNALIGQVRASEGRNITGKEIAERIGVQAATISRWVNGKTSLDQIEYLLTLLESVPPERWQSELRSALSSKSRKK
ncbi:helix-turn-helix transcriptional regulator [Ruficoccus amylovorans]|uniref:Helix-turn-helix transcriptional regulator n=1 Tax=Ruficoccus amylovorans TaxID=1804625 RepID=A0A842HBW6_9BACT|nr:helix-turn-helix transcriptional regulator [Ruficoccus amylovorans]MBC2593750.1 helix-turn-helix transcriptional regulator [Ruficoccus amylovorans]